MTGAQRAGTNGPTGITRCGSTSARTTKEPFGLASDWPHLHACAACRAGSSRHSFSVGGSPRAKADQSHVRSQDRRTPCALSCYLTPFLLFNATFKKSRKRNLKREVEGRGSVRADSVAGDGTSHTQTERKLSMPYITVGKENGANIDIYYKDWGKGQPIVFSHGWPLSADDWDTQMLFFVSKGFRVIASDRRGHGRSTQTSGGHDMDHYADDLAALTAHLDLHDAVHVGHSTGGGEVVHYIARHGESRVAKAVLISAVPPLMVQTDANPGGLPKSVFDDLQAQLAANRSEFYRALPSGPFYGFNRPGVQPSEAIIENWWRQGMMGGAKAHYDGIVAFSQTDFTEDLKKITVPVLVMHGDDDQIVPYADSGPLSAKLLQNGTLKTYSGFPHGMPTTQAETIKADLLAFLRS